MSANKEKSWCDYNEYRRPRYFHGMLLDDKDFHDEQNYHAGKRRLLNRTLHGSGVVCGLVLTKQGDQSIEVSAGLALDCCGNEIWVNKSLQLPLAKLIEAAKTSTDTNPCAEPAKPGDNLKCYLGIRYDEKGTDPVAVYLPGAGCDERTCQNSRIKEGYCFELVPSCPKKPEPPKECGPPIPCPECEHCDKPCYVILGQIEYKDGRIVNLFPEACREYVITGRLVQQLILSTSAKTLDVKGDATHPGTSDKGTEDKQPSIVELLCKILSTHETLSRVVKEQTASITKLQDAIRKPSAEAPAQPTTTPQPPPQDQPAPPSEKTPKK